MLPDPWGILFTLLLCFLYPIAAFGMGFWLVELLERFLFSVKAQTELRGFVSDRKKLLGFPALFTIGLLLLLIQSLLLFGIGTSIIFACLLPLGLGLSHPRCFKDFPRLDTSPGAVLWLLVVLAIGLTLFDALSGISTPWKNNYGDVTFHIGMITHFTFGASGFPEYHIFPGVDLSYPFLINFWTALLWWPSQSFELLSILFAYQFTLIWMVVWKSFRSPHNSFLPWAVLFGGGSLLYLGQDSAALIAEGHPWTVFLTTVWVTQRTSLFGLLIIASAYCLLRPLLIEEKEEFLLSRLRVSCAAILLALSPLAHTHMAFTTGIFCLVFLCLRPLLVKDESNALKLFYIFCCLASLSLLFLPLLLGKSSMLGTMMGWSTGDSASQLAPLRIWFLDAGVWMLFLFTTLIFLKKLTLALSLILLFVVANFISLSEWDWDQLKVFIALYTFSILLAENITGKKRWVTEILALLLCIPSLVLIYSQFQQGPMFEVYTKEDIAFAKAVREELSSVPNVIIAGAPKHNSAVTLTGFPLYYGYEGTLHSHALPYLERRKTAAAISRICACSQKICPTHLMWRELERSYFSATSPPSSCVRETGVRGLYELVSSSRAIRKESSDSGGSVAAPASE